MVPERRLVIERRWVWLRRHAIRTIWIRMVVWGRSRWKITVRLAGFYSGRRLLDAIEKIALLSIPVILICPMTAFVLNVGNSDCLWSSIDNPRRLADTSRSAAAATHAATTATAGMYAAPSVYSGSSAGIRARASAHAASLSPTIADAATYIAANVTTDTTTN